MVAFQCFAHANESYRCCEGDPIVLQCFVILIHFQPLLTRLIFTYFDQGCCVFKNSDEAKKVSCNITVCKICIHISPKLGSRTFHENAKGFPCFCSKKRQASWELSAHDQPIPAKAWHAIQACEHCSCTQFGEPNPAECSWHVTKVASFGISFCRDKTAHVPESICQILIPHHVFLKHSCHRWILWIVSPCWSPLVPNSVAAKASARYCSSRCTQCVPCGGASQRAAQWSAVHCALSRQLTSAAASSSRFRRSSLSEFNFSAFHELRKKKVDDDIFDIVDEVSQVSWKKAGVESWEIIPGLKAQWICDLPSSFGFYLGSWIKFPQGQCLAFFAAMWSGAPP